MSNYITPENKVMCLSCLPNAVEKYIASRDNNKSPEVLVPLFGEYIISTEYSCEQCGAAA